METATFPFFALSKKKKNAADSQTSGCLVETTKPCTSYYIGAYEIRLRMYFNTIYTILSNIKHFISTNFARNYFLQALNPVPYSFFCRFYRKIIA